MSYTIDNPIEGKKVYKTLLEARSMNLEIVKDLSDMALAMGFVNMPDDGLPIFDDKGKVVEYDWFDYHDVWETRILTVTRREGDITSTYIVPVEDYSKLMLHKRYDCKKEDVKYRCYVGKSQRLLGEFMDIKNARMCIIAYIHDMKKYGFSIEDGTMFPIEGGPDKEFCGVIEDTPFAVTEGESIAYKVAKDGNLVRHRTYELKEPAVMV